MKILLICGSATRTSRTRGLIQAVERELRKRSDVELMNFDVGTDVLPLYNGSEAQAEDEAVKRLRSCAEQADGFYICSPEYHAGMSGALKNTFDFLSGSHFRGKPVAISAASGGSKGGVNALNNMRTVLRGVYALVLPDQIVVDPDHFNEQRELVNEEMQKRIQGIVDELCQYVRSLAAGRQQQVQA
ncbi:NADPH-dependent FMN reductase [Brevibacillus sp. B_LB10_24]|uniref:NADPH-dependent FMN reductase n=1 Tax=Brevibacillus sp. B_LB10_24 TaxID=3380645 RepID=UPI0038B6B304